MHVSTPQPDLWKSHSGRFNDLEVYLTVLRKRIRYMHPAIRKIMKDFICPGVNSHGCGKKIFHIERVPDPNEKIYQILCVSGHSFHIFIDTIDLRRFKKIEDMPYALRRFKCSNCHKKVIGFYHHNVTNCPKCRRELYLEKEQKRITMQLKRKGEERWATIKCRK